MGGVFGLCGGAAMGWLLYRGLLAIPIGQFMTTVGWLILLLAAGLEYDVGELYSVGVELIQYL